MQDITDAEAQDPCSDIHKQATPVLTFCPGEHPIRYTLLRLQPAHLLKIAQRGGGLEDVLLEARGERVVQPRAQGAPRVSDVMQGDLGGVADTAS